VRSLLSRKRHWALVRIGSWQEPSFIQSATPVLDCRHKEDVERLQAELEAEKQRHTTELQGLKTKSSQEHASITEQLERARALHDDVQGRLTETIANETNATALLKEVKLEVRRGFHTCQLYARSVG